MSTLGMQASGLTGLVVHPLWCRNASSVGHDGSRQRHVLGLRVVRAVHEAKLLRLVDRCALSVEKHSQHSIALYDARTDLSYNRGKAARDGNHAVQLGVSLSLSADVLGIGFVVPGVHRGAVRVPRDTCTDAVVEVEPERSLGHCLRAAEAIVGACRGRWWKRELTSGRRDRTYARPCSRRIPVTSRVGMGWWRSRLRARRSGLWTQSDTM